LRFLCFFVVALDGYEILDRYLFLFHVEHQRLNVIAQRQLKLLGFLNLGERERA
jgi:hypothetical protein